MGKKSQIGIETLSPEQTGIIIKMRPQSIRLGLQQCRFDFGTAIQKENGRWTYNIIAEKVYRYAEITKEEAQKILLKRCKKGVEEDAVLN